MSSKIKNQDDKEAKAYNWVLLVTLLLILFLIVQTPARIMANFLPDSARSSLHMWGGTIWSGQVDGKYKEISGQLRWRLKPLAWLRLKLGLEIEIITNGSQFNAELLWGGSSWQLLDAKGQIASHEIQQMLQGWKLPNAPIMIQNLTLSYSQRAWQHSQGVITWQGGSLDYVLEGQTQHLNLPVVGIFIKDNKNDLELVLKDTQQDANLATFMVRGDILESRLTQRLLSYAPNYRGVAEPDAIVVTSTQPLNSL